jgi:hypothetical protein
MSIKRAMLLLSVLLLVGCGGSQSPAEVVGTQAATAPTAQAQPSAQSTTVPGAEAYPAPNAGMATQAAVEAYPKPEGSSTTAAGGSVLGGYPSPGGPGATQNVLKAADGVITDGEYAHQTAIGQVTIYWSNDDQYLYLAAESQTSGWLGIGLDPEERMKGADFVIAAQRDGVLSIYDAFGQGLTGPTHPEDVTIGGTTDLVASAAFQQDGWVRLEVQKPLDSGDAADRVLQPGASYSVIVATGTDMQFTSPHSFRGLGQITLD